MVTTPSGLPFVFRYSQDFWGLPPIYKWEFTRRHPYYLQYWRDANELGRLREDPETWNQLSPIERRRLSNAFVLLTAIGAITPKYPDPAIDARTEKDFDPPFNPRTALAMSMRAFFAFMYYNLPDEIQHAVARVHLREIAKEAASDDGLELLETVAKALSQPPPTALQAELILLKGDSPLYNRLSHALSVLSDPRLDEDVPGLLWVNVNMPLADIVSDVKAQVSQWKKEYGISETRRRQDQWDAYLDVWDRREGWHNGAYDGKRELRLSDIARELNVRPSTVQAHYEAAYKLIVGKEYDPTEWLALFVAVKLDGTKWGTWRRSKESNAGDAFGKAITGTPTNEGPEADDSADRIGQAADTGDPAAYRELVADLKTMLTNGRSYEDVKAELELEISAEDFAVMRARFEDGLL